MEQEYRWTTLLVISLYSPLILFFFFLFFLLLFVYFVTLICLNFTMHEHLG